jgi:hypothetical protein
MILANYLGTQRRMVLGVICLVFLATLLSAQVKGKRSYLPPEGMVPDKETAVKIAEAVLTPIYGSKMVEREKPFRVELVKGVWIVDGALHPGPGGNLHIEISRKDGRIMRVIGTE